MKRSPRLKIKDLQFARHFLLHKIDLHDRLVMEMLESEVEVRQDGEADSVLVRNDLIIISNPSSVTKFLFSVLYSALSKHVTKDIHKDKLGLGLLHMCKQYVYSDFNLKEKQGPPVLMDFHKLPVPSFILHELVEPIVGKLKYYPVFFVPCKFTDVCRTVESLDSLINQYDLPRTSVGYNDFPLILCNTKIHNSAATMAHLTMLSLEMSLGKKRCQKVIKSILLNGEFVEYLTQIIKTLRGEIDFVVNFLDYLSSNAMMSGSEQTKTREYQFSVIAEDKFLSSHIKIASPQNTQVSKQWSQWSMLMGLIEKQLTPMRGSMWPASENIKPHEDRLRNMQLELAKKKGKSQLNFEELLETYRSQWGHRHHEPGKIIEHMLKDERVWKS